MQYYDDLTQRVIDMARDLESEPDAFTINVIIDQLSSEFSFLSILTQIMTYYGYDAAQIKNRLACRHLMEFASDHNRDVERSYPKEEIKRFTRSYGLSKNQACEVVGISPSDVPDSWIENQDRERRSISDEDIREIEWILENETTTQKSIAHRFNISEATVSRIASEM